MSKKKEGKKGEDNGGKKIAIDDVEPNYRDLCNEELFNSWQVNSFMVDHLLDMTMKVLKDKEIARLHEARLAEQKEAIERVAKIANNALSMAETLASLTESELIE